MKKLVNLTCFLLVAFMLQSASGFAANPKILVFTKTKGFFHTSIPIFFQEKSLLNSNLFSPTQ